MRKTLIAAALSICLPLMGCEAVVNSARYLQGKPTIQEEQRAEAQKQYQAQREAKAKADAESRSQAEELQRQYKAQQAKEAERLYREGMKAPNTEAGAEKLRQAVEYGHTDAAYQLARIYLKGNVVDYRPLDAIQLLQIAASQKHAQAQYLLGEFYRGNFLSNKRDEDLCQSYLYLEAARLNGVRDASAKAAQMKAYLKRDTGNETRNQYLRDWLASANRRINDLGLVK